MKDYVELRKILDKLPHGKKALLVDSAKLLDSGNEAEGEVTFSHNAFSDHFPDDQFAPGSVLIEAASQVAQFLVCSLPNMRKKALLVAKQEVTRFRAKVFPGQKLVTQAKIVEIAHGYIHVETESYCEGKKVLESGFWYKIPNWLSLN